VGLPEKVEKGNPTHFIADLLPNFSDLTASPDYLKVDRAHRIGTQSSLVRPRSMISKIHHFPEKKKILNFAHRQSPLSFNGARFSIYPDFPPEVSDQRRAFDGAKKN